MPLAGQRQTNEIGRSYRKDPLFPYAKAFLEAANTILESEGLDIFDEPNKVYRRSMSKESMKKFFMEDSIDTSNDTIMDDEDIEDNEATMEAYFENDLQGLFEHSVNMDYAPVIGMALPIHKLILMNNVFDKGAIQKVVALQPSFTISMERRILVTPEGEELDMALDQNKMTAAIDATNPTKDFELTLPQTEDDNDLVAELGGTTLDSLDVETYISAVKIEGVVIEPGDVLPNEEGFCEKGGKIADTEIVTDLWFRTDIRFYPNYGKANHFERATVQPITITCKKKVDGVTKEVRLKDAISASMNKSKFNIQNTYGNVTAVKLTAKLDTSNAMLDTCSVKWKQDSDVVEIGTSIPINTTISPQEIKDRAAMYNVNQITKLMGMFKTAMANYKDDKIKQHLDLSYKRLDETNSFHGKFDFAPRDGFYADHVTWRSATFMDYLDSFATRMLMVLNDPNMTFTIFGDPEIVRKITPKDYTYQAPSNIGAVTLDYTQTIVNTTDKRIYSFIGSDKMRNTKQLMIILNPRNSERIIYRIYDYQMYVSNEIRNISNPALPAISAFERWKFVEYQPVQGRIDILHPSGLLEA